jgi:hypothetical protein
VTRATGRDVQYPLTLAYSRIPLPVAATAATALEAIELEVGLIPGRRPDGSLVLLPSSYNPGDGLWTETTVSTLPHRLQTDDLPPDGKEWNQEILDRAMGSLIYLPASARESLEFGLGELEASLPPSFLLHHITVQADGSSSAGRHDLIVEFAGLVAEGDPGSHLRGIRRRLEQRLGGSDPQAIALGRIQNSSDAWPAMAFVLPIPPRGRP